MEKHYKFKEGVSSNEKAEVMKTIKYSIGNLVAESSFESHPELKSYFKEYQQQTIEPR